MPAGSRSPVWLATFWAESSQRVVSGGRPQPSTSTGQRRYTRQDKTRDKTRQDKTRRDKTRQDKTSTFSSCALPQGEVTAPNRSSSLAFDSMCSV
eukprot:scaffold37931_cov78-Phaeocystis_antarctica.AAC.2